MTTAAQDVEIAHANKPASSCRDLSCMFHSGDHAKVVHVLASSLARKNNRGR